MFDYVATQAALEKHIAGIVGLPTVAKENTKFNPTLETPHVIPSFMPGALVPAALGEGADNRCEGIYQILVCYPTGSGRGPALAMAGKVVDRYRRGLILVEGSVKVEVTNSSVLPPRPGTEWYQVPVDIRWRSDQPI